MKRALATLSAATLLIFSAHRVPAPIMEQTPAPTESAATSPAPSTKHKSLASASSNLLARFEGTWRSASNRKAPNGNQFGLVQTIVIRNGVAELTLEHTSQLSSGQKWNDFSSPYNTYSPLYTKRVNRSNSIRAEGSNLRVQWAGARLVEWSPKSIPLSAFKNTVGKPGAVLLIRSGDQLIDTSGKSSATYSRVQ